MKFLILLMLLCGVLSVTPNTIDKNSKLVQLRKLALASDTYIVELNEQTYKHYVEESPRPYTLVILFYANSEVCEQVFKEFIFAASHFKEKQTHLTQKIGKEYRRPIFFAALKFSQENMRIFRDLDFRGVPNLLISTPKEVSFKDPLEKKMYQRQFLWEIQPSDGLITAKKLVLWLADKTQVNVEYKESLLTFLESLVYLLIVVVVFVFIYIKANVVILHPIFWIFIFFAGYYVSCAGVVYCILNHARWVGEKDGQPEYIDPGARSQFVSEGLMMSGAILGVSALWIAFVKIGLYVKNVVAQKVVYAIICFGLYFIVNEVEEIFRSKNSYNPNYAPPSHYRKGPLRFDQGHSV